ncbi:MAG: bifunctional phosphoglucose/phosphomannose isomerase [Chloroflexi bacterium]|nr:bifunctional phosphoglucose/phosphomannose isomerase [Chloroflexota bacterium]
MNLDELNTIRQIDTQGMLSHINGLPDQLIDAWNLGQTLPLPPADGLRNILVAGMGGSAIGADLLASYVAPLCPVPIIVHRDYSLPAWAGGPETLVIASSHSGNTEETVAAFEQAHSRGCRVMVISTGGKLGEMARQAGYPLWKFNHSGQPRTAVGYSFGLLLAALYRMGLIPDPSADLEAAVQAMRSQQINLLPEVPTVQNPAKRLAGQLIDRWPVVIAADHLEPVARRWKGQISENAKAWGQFEFLPEADHNTLAGLNNPETMLPQAVALFLRAPSNNPRNLLRLDLTRKMFMTQGLNTDMIDAKGDSPMAHIWTLLHLGDYISFYLAMAYGEDPTPVDALATLKNELSQATS